ncbi:MAG TPA: sigma-70 family RNA polymerase sigma factor [Gemmataceae bacterium]|nr:sigma-70 family RNA polymerase sigma factor [Gemmataceae bacterium]
MAQVQLVGALHHLRRATASAATPELTDSQLLERYVAGGDEDAFARLVRRHGRLVRSVCRNVLRDEQDIDDASQATFLVLATKAASIRKTAAVASWLYGVAHRTAMNAKRARLRRRERQTEQEASAREQPATDASLREIQAILDEELNRLPERQRAAFVLCCLEGKTKAEAARELGWKEGTVASRLARTRKELQRRLIRRGVALSSALCAVELGRTTAAAAVPPIFIQSMIKAALAFAAGRAGGPCGISAGAAGLAHKLLHSMLMNQMKIATVILILVTIFTGTGVLACHALIAKRTGLENSSAQPEWPQPRTQTADRGQATEAESASAKTVAVRGQVLGPTGKPVAGARLYLLHWPKGAVAGDVDMLLRGTSASDGRFSLQLPTADAHHQNRGQPVPLIAAADGLGLDWVDLPADGLPNKITFHLVRDMPVRIRIVGTEGKPIPGVAVNVGGVMAPDKLEESLKAWQRSPRATELAPGKGLMLPLAPILHPPVSDKEGKVEIPGIGADRFVTLEVKHPDYVQSTVIVVTSESLDLRTINRKLAKDSPAGLESWRTTLLGPNLAHVLEPIAPVEGTVREAGTGNPVVGATIQGPGDRAISDSRGHFRLRGLRKTERYTLHVMPPENALLIDRWVRLASGPGPFTTVKADIELPHGVLLTGRVVDKATCVGLDKIDVSLMPLPDNKFLKQAPIDLGFTARTDASGRFRLVALPGSGVLLARAIDSRRRAGNVWINLYKKAKFDAEDRKRVQIHTDPEGDLSFLAGNGGNASLSHYNAARVVDIGEGGSNLARDLVLDRGRTVSVSVADAEGKPLAGAIAAGVSSMWPEAIFVEAATCPVYALDPEQPRQLLLVHPERKLAVIVTVRGDENGPLAARLGPTGIVTGRLLDTEGRPIPAAEVAVLYSGTLGRDLSRQLSGVQEPLRTDDNGRFRLEGIVPGLEFELAIARDRQRLGPETRSHPKAVKASSTLDLGDIRVKAE